MSLATKINRSITTSGVKALARLSDSQVKKLEDDYNIVSLWDLALLDKANVYALLGNEMGTFIV
eukprot:14271442-Ditylum_brightwellii.AAC.1